jgi:hypothetical protein
LLLAILPAKLLVGQSIVEVGPELAAKYFSTESSPPSEFQQATFRVDGSEGAIGINSLYFNAANNDRVQVAAEIGFDRSSNAARRAAAKAYVNELASTFRRQNFELSEMHPENLVDDFDQVDFAEPLTVSFVFASNENAKVFVRMRVFFTDHGFCVTTVSDNAERLKTLNEWADTFTAVK